MPCAHALKSAAHFTFVVLVQLELVAITILITGSDDDIR